MDVISLLISILVIVIVFGIIWLILTRIPLPDPFGWIAQLVLLVIFLLVLLAYLLPFAHLTPRLG